MRISTPSFAAGYFFLFYLLVSIILSKADSKIHTIGITNADAFFGFAYAWTEEPVIWAKVNRAGNETWLPIAPNTTQYAYFGGYPDKNITSTIEVATFTKACILQNSTLFKDKIVLLGPSNDACSGYQPFSAALVLLDAAGAKALLINSTLPFPHPRAPAWISVAVSAAPIYVNVSTYNLIYETYLQSLSGTSSLEITILPPDPTIKNFIESSKRGDLTLEIVPSVIYSLLFIFSCYVFVVRVHKEWNLTPSRVSKLLRLCLLFVMASCITRILFFPINYKGKGPTIVVILLNVFEGYGFGFDLSALFLVISSWILVVSFAPRFFTPDRVFRGTLISLIGLYIILILINALAQTQIVRAIILVLMLIAMIGFSVSGSIFLIQLKRSTSQSAGYSRGGTNSDLVNLHLRMTICLVVCSIGIISLIVLVLIDAVTDSPLNWQLFPFLYELLRFIILTFIVAALYVSPKRSGSTPSASSISSRRTNTDMDLN